MYTDRRRIKKVIHLGLHLGLVLPSQYLLPAPAMRESLFSIVSIHKQSQMTEKWSVSIEKS
jgi:hypothetical protein